MLCYVYLPFPDYKIKNSIIKLHLFPPQKDAPPKNTKKNTPKQQQQTNKQTKQKLNKTTPTHSLIKNIITTPSHRKGEFCKGF